jgi:hypothetical protein
MEEFTKACNMLVDAPVRKIAVVYATNKNFDLDSVVCKLDVAILPDLCDDDWRLLVINTHSSCAFLVCFNGTAPRDLIRKVVPTGYTIKIFIPTDKKESTGLSVCRTIVKILCMERLDYASFTELFGPSRLFETDFRTTLESLTPDEQVTGKVSFVFLISTIVSLCYSEYLGTCLYLL